MSKITRRFFLGATGVLLVMPWKWGWVETTASGARARVTSWRLRYRRWRYGIQPRWVQWKNTNVTRYQDGSAHEIVAEWRDLRWPDNDEVVDRKNTGGSGRPVDRMEWSEREQSFKPFGLPAKTGVELVDKVRRVARSYDAAGGGASQSNWVKDCRDTVAKWDAPVTSKLTEEELAILYPAVKMDGKMAAARRREDMLPTAFRLVEGDPRDRSFTEEELAFLEPALERTRAIVEHEKRHPWVPGRGPARPWFVHRIGEWLFPKS